MKRPEQEWKAIKKGYVLYVVSVEKFVLAVCQNGISGRHSVYGTDYLWEAKAWKTINGATKTAAKVSKELGEAICVCHFRYDEETEKRVVTERLMWGVRH